MESPNFVLSIRLDPAGPDRELRKPFAFTCPVRMDRATRWPYRIACVVTVPPATPTGTSHVATASGVGATPMEAIADLIADLITLSKTQPKANP